MISPPMYGMNRPKKTMTASGATERHPQDPQEEPDREPVERRDDRGPAQVPADARERVVAGRRRSASRRQALADDIAQTHALSPSIMKKKVRNVARIAMVAIAPMVATIARDGGGHPGLEALRRALDRTRPTSGGMSTSASSLLERRQAGAEGVDRLA